MLKHLRRWVVWWRRIENLRALWWGKRFRLGMSCYSNRRFGEETNCIHVSDYVYLFVSVCTKTDTNILKTIISDESRLYSYEPEIKAQLSMSKEFLSSLIPGINNDFRLQAVLELSENITSHTDLKLPKLSSDVMVIIVWNRHGDPGSNPGRGCLHFTQHKYIWERYESKYFPSSYV